jgi:hypothetical protein
MRQRELIDGVMVHDEQGRELTYSKQAAMTGISQVCMSRITMVAPGMIIVPIIVQQLEKNPFFRVCVVALVSSGVDVCSQQCCKQQLSGCFGEQWCLWGVVYFLKEVQ